MVSQVKTDVTIEKLKRGAWLVNHVDFLKWGTEIVVYATYDPSLEFNTDFQLIFKNCKHTYWEVIEDYDEREIQADVIGMSVETSQPDIKTIISTQLFELGIEHDELIFHKDW